MDDIKAGTRDLVRSGSKGGGGKVEYAKIIEFGSSLTIEADLRRYEEKWWFPVG